MKKRLWIVAVTVAVAVGKSVAADDQIEPAKKALARAIDVMHKQTRVKTNLLTPQQLSSLLEDFSREIKAAGERVPELQALTPAFSNIMGEVRNNPIALEPLLRLTIMTEKAMTILAAKGQLDTGDRLSSCARKLNGHLVDVAQTTDLFIEKAFIVRRAP